MSLFVILNGADVGATTVRLRSGGENGIPGLTTSANGVGSMGGIVFDDPSSALTVQGWMPITVDEPDCVGAARIGTGYVGDRTYERGPYLTGTGRHIDTTIYDPMTLLSFLLITGSDGKRPAETHIDTIDWLLASAYLPPNTIYDLGLVDRSHPRPFPASDYRGQYAADVLNAIAGPIFQTFFLVWDQSAHKLSLFFDSPVATTNTATLTISNVPADVNNTTCFYPSKDAKLGVDPSSVYAKLRYTYRHGTTITNRAATATAFFGSLGYRGVKVNNDRVGLASTARTSSENLLDQYGEEAETLQFTVQLPSTKVGLIDAGMRLGVRFQHLPGYTSLTYVRVEGRTIMQSEGTDKQYDVQLTCSNHGLTTALGGGDPGGFPHPSAEAPSLVQDKTKANTGVDASITLDDTPTEGNLLVAVVGWRASAAAPSILTGFTQVGSTVQSPAGGGTNCVYVAYRIVQAGDTATFTHAVTSGKEHTIVMSEWLGTWVTPLDSTASGTASGSLTPSVPITPTVGKAAVIIGGAINSNGNTPSDSGYIAGAGFTLIGQANVPSGSPVVGAVYATTASTSGSYSPNLSATGGFGAPGASYWAEIAAVFVTDASEVIAPMPGQWVYGDIPTPAPDGTTVLFTLTYPYVAGSLKVRVDGVPILNGLTETDPDTGTFTLDFAPLGASGDTRAEIIDADYQSQ